MRKNKINATHDDLLYIVQKLDLDKDGQIGYLEFVRAILSNRGKKPNIRLQMKTLNTQSPSKSQPPANPKRGT